MSQSKDQIFQEAIDVFGTRHQINMAIEECAELIKALNKCKRTFKIKNLGDIRDGKLEFKNVNEALVYANICSEIADVKITVGQLEKIFKSEQINISEERKLIRLVDGIEKKKNKNNGKKNSEHKDTNAS